MTSLRQNIAALGVVQMAALLTPLLSATYSTRVLGAEAWGRLAVVQVVLAYFSVFTSWSFNVTATRKIAAARDDAGRVASVAASALQAQLLLTAGAGLVIVVLVLTTPHFRHEAAAYAWGFVMLVATALFPSWLYSGLERMRDAAAIQLTSRVAGLVALVLLVQGPQDAPRVIAATAIGAAVAAGLGLAQMRGRLSGVLHKTGVGVGQEIREGRAFFVASASVSLYMNIAPLVVGVVMGPIAAGYYVLADRIRLAAQSALLPISLAVFPRLSRLATHDRAAARLLLWRTGPAVVGGSLLIGVLLFAAAGPLVRLLGGAAFEPAEHLLRWLALVPIVTGLSTFLGPQVLLPLQHNRAYNVIVLGGGLFSLAVVFPMTRWLGATGAALATIATEALVSAAMLAFVWRLGAGTPRGARA